MSEVRLVAEPRTEFGKGAARRVRRAHKVPAVLYGHGTKPVHVSLPGHDLALALRRDPNVLLTLELDGQEQLALPRAVTRDPIKGFLEHVDLLVVERGERVTVELPVTVTGEPTEGLAEQQLQTLPVEAEATHLPEGVEVSVEGLEPGSQVTAGSVALPQGATLATDPEALVVSVVGATADVALDEAGSDDAAGTPSGEGDGLGDRVADTDSDEGGPGGAPEAAPAE